MEKQLETELKEFRQRWLASLTQIMPSHKHSLTTISSNSVVDDSRSRDLEAIEPSPRPTQDWRQMEADCHKDHGQKSESKCSDDDFSFSKCEIASRSLPLKSEIVASSFHRRRKTHTERIWTKRRRRGSIGEDLVGQLIADINEITDVPFFDVKLPKEVGIKVFSFLDYRDLCHCSQVSWSWHALADDEVLWCRVCQKYGFEKERSLGVAARVGWKGLVRYHFVKAQMLKQNWQERRCQTQELQNPRCRVLCHANSNGSRVIAGYDTGDVCLWNVTKALDRATVLSHNNTTPEGGNRVTCTAVTDLTSAASFLNGDILVWNSVTGERQLLYSVPGCTKCIALSPEGNCLAVASNNGVQTTFRSHQLCHVYQSYSDTEEWLWLCKDTFDIPPHAFSGDGQPPNIKNVSFVHSSLDSHQVVITSDRDVQLHTIGCSPDKMLTFEGGEARQIRLTCSDSTNHLLACGVSGYGFDALSEGCKVRLHNLQTGQFLYSLSGHGSDVLCVDIARAPENMLISGSADKSVRVFDLRMGSSVVVLRGHISYVSHVQMDDWKVVSGTNDGTVYVWDQRMMTPLWETHSRHPVQLCCFHDTRLITANMPIVQQFVYPDTDEGIFHRRLTGSIHVFDFSVVSELDTQDLPSVCYSNYDEPSASNYRVGLAAPYDCIS